MRPTAHSAHPTTLPEHPTLISLPSSASASLGSSFGVTIALIAVAIVAILSIGTAPTSAQELILADGFELGLPGGWSSVMGVIPPAPFRISDLDLRDPHVYADASGLACIDFTDDSILGLAPSFNDQLATAISTDGDGDGLLDLSILLLLRPLDLNGQGLALETRSAACTAPLATTTCGPQVAQPPALTTYDTSDTGTCLEPLAGTTHGYSPGILDPLAPCFCSAPQDLILYLNDMEIPLTQARVAATFHGDPVNRLVSGLVMGFLRESEADATPLPADLPVIGGNPLSSVLPGGSGCCASHDDRDSLDGESGWWLYLNLEADSVVYSGP